MSLHYSCWPPHSKPSYPQQVPSLAEYHSSTNSVATPFIGAATNLPLFKPTLPMGTIHRHLKRKLSSISSEAGQKEEPCTRPMLDIKKPRRWGPDGRVVQTGTHQHVAFLLPTKPDPVHVGGTRITAVTSAWRVHPASRDDESSDSDISDDDDETTVTHTTRNMTEQPSTVYKDANQFLNSLHKARASRPSSVLLSLQTPNTGTAQTFPRRISTNHSPLPHLHLKKPTGPLRHPPHQENPDEQAEKDLVTKQYEEANQLLRMLKLKRRPPSLAPAMDSSYEEKNEGNE